MSIAHRCKPLENGVRYEGVVVDPVLDPHPLPRVHSHADRGREDPRVLVQKVLGQKHGKPLRVGHSVSLGQKVDGVFLAVGGDDVLVVALWEAIVVNRLLIRKL